MFIAAQSDVPDKMLTGAVSMSANQSNVAHSCRIVSLHCVTQHRSLHFHRAEFCQQFQRRFVEMSFLLYSEMRVCYWGFRFGISVPVAFKKQILFQFDRTKKCASREMRALVEK